MYQNYIFDLYGTLVDIHTDEEKDAVWEQMAKLYSYNGASYIKEELQKDYLNQVQVEEDLVLKSDIYSEIQLERVFADLYRKKAIEPSIELVADAARVFRSASTEEISLYEGAKELLECLKKEGKKIYLLTNAQRIFTEYEIKMLGIWEYFDDIFMSSEIGYKKPSKKFFEALFQKHKLQKNVSLMIGNDVEADIQGANLMGIDSVYLHSNLSPDIIIRPKSTYSITPLDLIELAQILV